MGGKRVWSYSTGRRGVNAVTVYEREKGAQLYIVWYDDDGRHDETIESMTGIVVPNDAKELGQRIADELSKAQANKRAAKALETFLGFNPNRTLEELLDALHDAKEAEWSESYTRDQKRFKAFWEAKLGTETRLVSVSARDVEKIVQKEAKARRWADRTRQAYLKYIVSAYNFAQRKLKWLTERHNLSAVDFPSPDPESKAYTEDELKRLLPALRKVDLRAGGVGEIAYATGRRLNAIRLLLREGLHLGVDVPIVRFPGRTDKARRSGEAVLTDHAVTVLGELVETPAVQATGLLFPAGDLGDDTSRRDPISREELIQMLHDAEKIADPKIPHVKGRAYHGIKRRVASMVKDRRGMAKQSGTTEVTLRRVYEQDDLAPKKAVADFLASRREGE